MKHNNRGSSILLWFKKARIFVLLITKTVIAEIKNGTKRGNLLDRRKSTLVACVLISLCSRSLSRSSSSSLKFSLHHIIVQSYNEMLIMVNVANIRQLQSLQTITREMPPISVYIGASAACDDGQIFKQAYAASLFGVGR